MSDLSRREFLAYAAALGVSAAWGEARARNSRLAWTERGEAYPEGVASGDPTADGVILWTRRPFTDGNRSASLAVEIAEDERFHRVVATTSAPRPPQSDWTCRVLVGGLKPARVYWYRFTDSDGYGSRIGRTLPRRQR